jgi:hypothetical protein
MLSLSMKNDIITKKAQSCKGSEATVARHKMLIMRQLNVRIFANHFWLSITEFQTYKYTKLLPIRE